MSQHAAGDVPGHPLIECRLQLSYDGTISVLAKRGCTDLEVYELLMLLASARWQLGRDADGAS